LPEANALRLWTSAIRIGPGTFDDQFDRLAEHSYLSKKSAADSIVRWPFNIVRRVPVNNTPRPTHSQPERVKGTVPFSLRRGSAKIGTVPDHWYIIL
jgi:hypothetical protein